MKRTILKLIRRAGYDLVKRNSSLSPAGDDLPLYREIYGSDVLDRRPFLNVGAAGFRHPAWRNLDFETENYAGAVIDIPHDLSLMQSFPLEDGSMEIVYTSHTIEHLQDDHDLFLFREAWRVLKPGGTIRVTCPDIALYWRACRLGDRSVFPYYGIYYQDQPVEQLLLREFATQISEANNDNLPIPKVATEELRRLFSSLPMGEAFDRLCSRIDYRRWYKTVPGNHVNWWDHDKVMRFLKRAGFADPYRSGYLQSFCKVLRNDPLLFDGTEFQRSLYVEARKT